MAVAQLNTSTLSVALTDSTKDFAVGSTTNISVGNLLVVRNEVMKVQAIPTSGNVSVARGFAGTKAVAHASGQRFFIGTPDQFKAIKESLSALVGDAGTYPDYMLPGQRARDGQGNEYVLVDLTATCYTGTTVVISVDGLYTATQAAGGTQGSIGLTVEQGTSAQYVWAQIYGYNAFAQETVAASAGTSAYIATAATTASTPSVGLAALASADTTVGQYVIHGMFIVGAASSASTSTSDAPARTGISYPVFLNYPYTLNRVEAIDTSNS